VDGSYEVPDIAPGMLKVELPTRGPAKDGMPPVFQPYFAGSVRSGVVRPNGYLRIDFSVSVVAEIAGIVLEAETSLPLADVEIRLSELGGAGKAVEPVRTDSSGVFRFSRLSGEFYSLTARFPGYVPVALEKLARTECAASFRVVTVQLQRQHTVSGRVVDEMGEPLEGVRVTTEHRVEGGWRDCAVIRTGRDGAFSLPVSHQSLNTVRAFGAGYEPVKVASVLPDTTSLRLVLRPNGRTACTGRVLHADGTPVVAFRVQWISALGSAGATDLCDPQGRFDLEVPAGRVSLRITSWEGADYRWRTLNLPKGQRADLGSVSLLRGVTLALSLFRSSSVNPVTDAAVSAPAFDLKARFQEHDRSFEIRSLPMATEIEILVEHEGCEPLRVVLPGFARPGRYIHTLSLSAGMGLVPLRVRDTRGRAVAGAEAVLLLDGRPATTLTTGPRGTVVFANLPQGKVRVRVSATGFVTHEEAYPPLPPGEGGRPGSYHILVLRRGGSLWGAVTAAGGPLPREDLPKIHLYRLGDSRPVATTVPVEVGSGWRYEFAGLEEGVYFAGNTAYALYPHRRVAVTRAGAARLDLDFPGRCLVRVAVRELGGTPVGSTTAYLYERKSWAVERRIYLDDEGQGEVPLMPVGDYALAVIVRGASDQFLLPFSVTEGVEVLDCPLVLPPRPCSLQGRVLLRSSREGWEAALFQPVEGVSSFSLRIRLGDQGDSIEVVAFADGDLRSAGQAAALLNDMPDFLEHFRAEAVESTLRIIQKDASALPHFSVEAADENARRIFGRGVFSSSNRVTGVYVSVEWIEAKVQTMLAGHMAVTAEGYFHFPALPAGRVRVRVVPNYSGAEYRLAFSETLRLAPEKTTFVTLFTDRNFADAFGKLTGADGVPLPATSVVYVDDLSRPVTGYPASLSPRGITSRSGLYFGTYNRFNIRRLFAGHTYRAVIHAAGFAPYAFEFRAPDAGETITLPPITLRPR
jgi:hypothetical protein